MRDTLGNQMDQNGNNIAGEVADKYLGSALVVQADVTFTTPTTIIETNTAYENKSLLINGTTVTIDGLHHFKAIHLINGAVLTHTANTATATHNLDLTVNEQVIVSSTSRVAVSCKGYLPGRTVGNTTVGGAAAGGSYGGLGGVVPSRGPTNAVYGDYADPSDMGDGGANASGGGLVRVVAGTQALDGQLLADGDVGSGTGGAGGAGGGGYVDAATLTGSIRAAGGNAGGGNGGVGGGGFDLARATAPGGTAPAAPLAGGAGPVYLRDTDEAAGTVVIDNLSHTGWTPLGLPGQSITNIPDAVVVRNSNVRSEHSSLSIAFVDCGALSHSDFSRTSSSTAFSSATAFFTVTSVSSVWSAAVAGEFRTANPTTIAPNRITNRITGFSVSFVVYPPPTVGGVRWRKLLGSPRPALGTSSPRTAGRCFRRSWWKRDSTASERVASPYRKCR